MSGLKVRGFLRGPKVVYLTWKILSSTLNKPFWVLLETLAPSGLTSQVALKLDKHVFERKKRVL